MASVHLSAFVRHVRAVVSQGTEMARTDRQLFASFVTLRDEAAFAELVARHGGMVLRVCRNVLRNEQDAEEALQATFLLLARRAAGLRDPDALASWLHGVAYRTALRARRDAARRRAREVSAQQASSMSSSPPTAELAWRELQALLDEELQRLPDKLRSPFVLCCLEGHSKATTARMLGWKPGTVSGRLDEARKTLRLRLARRGVSLSAVLCGLTLASKGAALPAALAVATVRAAWGFRCAGAVIAPAEQLAQGVLREGLLAKARTAAIAFLGLGVLVAGVGASFRLPAEAASNQAAAPPPVAAPPTPGAVPRTDRYGDALPENAFARLGTKRFGHSFMVDKVVWSPDGRHIVSLGGHSTGRQMVLWEASSGKELHEFAVEGSVCGASFSPDGKTLAAGDRHGVGLWDVASRKEVGRFAASGDTLVVAYSPDGKALAGAGRDGVLRVWQLTDRREIAQLPGHKDLVRQIAWSPDGTTLASGCNDGTLRLWDVAASKELWQRSPHGPHMWPVAFAPDGKTLASGGNDNIVRIWDAWKGEELRAIATGLSDGPRDLAFSPDGKLLAMPAKHGNILLCDPATGKEVRRWQAGVSINSLCFSPDSKTIASGGGAGSFVRLWDVASGRERMMERSHMGPLEAVAFTPDGKSVWSYARDKSRYRWNVATGEGQRFFGGLDNGAWDPTCFSTDGQMLVTGGRRDGQIRLWDNDGKELATLGKHAGRAEGVAISPDGKLLASSGKEGEVRLWDVAARKYLRDLEAPSDRWASLTFSPDGRKLAIGGSCTGLGGSPPCLLDTNTGKIVLKLEGVSGESRIVFSPDGRLLAVAGAWNDKVVRLHDAATGKQLGECAASSRGVWSLAFSADSRLLAAGATERDDTVRVWEVATLQEVADFVGHHSGVGALAFTPDGRTLASGAGDATILLWDLAGRSRAAALTPARLEECWESLRGADAAKAYKAVWALANDSRQSAPFLGKRLRPAVAAEAAKLAALVAGLDADAFADRERAEAELAKLGDAAEGALRKLLEKSPTPEARRRTEDLLSKLATAPEWTQARRAIQALDYAATPEARRVLETLAGGVAEARLTAEAKAALARMK